MPHQDFRNRLARPDTGSELTSSSNASGPIWTPAPSRLPALLFGVSVSVLVMTAFHNMQAISEAAPAVVKESKAPGALGLPIALISGFWIAYTAYAFVNGVSRAAYGTGHVSPFHVGAFLAVGGYFILFHTRVVLEQVPF